MAANPILLFGVISGVIAAIVVYMRSRLIKNTIFAFVLVFLALGTPLHFPIIGAYLGSRVNQVICCRWSHNWGAFLVSLIGALPLFAVWQASVKLLLPLAVSGVDDAGGAIVLGIGIAIIHVVLMIIGLVFYALLSFYTSYKRREKMESETID